MIRRFFVGARMCGLVCAGALMAGTATGQDLANGKTLYEGDANCVDCHGLTGMGDGPTAELFDLDVRNFTTGPLEFDTDGDCEAGSADDMFDVVRQGPEAFGGSDDMEPVSVGDLADADLIDVIAYIRDEFTSQIPAIACDLCGADVVVAGKGKLKVKGKGKAKNKPNWDIDLVADGTWVATDGGDTFQGCWVPEGGSGRKYGLAFDDDATLTLLNQMTELGQTKISSKIVDTTTDKTPDALLKVNKGGTKATLELSLKGAAVLGSKEKKAKYSAEAKGDL